MFLFFFVIPGDGPSAYTIPNGPFFWGGPLSPPLTHLCDLLEVEYGGVLGSKLFGGVTGIGTPDLLHASQES